MKPFGILYSDETDKNAVIKLMEKGFALQNAAMSNMDRERFEEAQNFLVVLLAIAQIRTAFQNSPPGLRHVVSALPDSELFADYTEDDLLELLDEIELKPHAFRPVECTVVDLALKSRVGPMVRRLLDDSGMK